MEAAGPKCQRPRPSCKAKAVDFLARSDQSIRRLTEKLQRKEYTEEEIQETIDWLQEKHFCIRVVRPILFMTGKCLVILAKV